MNLLNQNNTLAMLIDVQEKLAPAIEHHENILSRILFLSQALNILQIPLLITEQYPKGLGRTLPILRGSIEAVATFEKTEFSAYLNQEIKQELIRQNKKQIILIGIETHVCILQTAYQLQRHGYEVFIPQDTTGSRHQDNKANALKRLSLNQITITNSESCVFELMESSTHPKFKEISKLIKT